MTIGIPSASPTGDGGDSFRASDWQGKTVMFAGIEKRNVDTAHGAATIADVSLIAVLDADEGVQIFTDCWVFGASLAPTLYKSPQDVIVGVLGKGDAKPGKNPPWTLQDPTEQNLEAARAWYGKFVKHSEGSTEYFYSPDSAPF